jgi:hypothetical protein
MQLGKNYFCRKIAHTQLGARSPKCPELLNPAKQSKQAKQTSKQANQQIGLG